jgi:two-component system, OmpR family, copper resistance phosphate regulon response regulator CusR
VQVLLVEAQKKLGRLIRSALQSDDLRVEVIAGAALPIPYCQKTSFDAILLDVSCVKPDGIALVKALRHADGQVPLLAFNGSPSFADRIAALRAGSDDYLSTPVCVDELVLRVQRLLRKDVVPRSTLRTNGLQLNYASHSVIRDGKEISLTPKEFAVLEILLLNAGRPVARQKIFKDVWREFERPTNVVDVYINFLRKKIDQGFETRLIRTAHGVGYALVTQARDAA